MEDKKLDRLEEDIRDCVIEGVDTMVGLRSVGGKMDVYIDVLRSFSRESHEIIDNLETYREDSPKIFHMKVHGLKSSCAYIGAAAAADEARGLEKAIIEGNEVYISTNIFFFEKNMNSLLKAVDEYLLRTKQKDLLLSMGDEREFCAIPGIPRSMAGILREAILNMENVEIRRRLAIIREKRYEREIEVYLGKIEHELENLDYEEALVLLAKITEKI